MRLYVGYCLSECYSFGKPEASVAAILERWPAACYYPAIEGIPVRRERTLREHGREDHPSSAIIHERRAT